MRRIRRRPGRRRFGLTQITAGRGQAELAEGLRRGRKSKPEPAFVTLVTRWHNSNGEHSQRELSAFVQNEGRWYLIDPTAGLNAGRNDPCPCASG
jgi:uncharacterized protein YchJ